ncbi:MAG: DNA polymerase/3'-5' exonuclease PolX [Candidatus Omnitrophica bacterium]|nr:DNA polymerase/3'-5' exonuclease PolX [Candidatus Omnitrophota bacterium]
MQNDEVASIFREIAMMLELRGENFFRIRAYERAARVIEEAGFEVIRATEGQLSALPGIGNDLRKKIEELRRSGECALHRKLRAEFPHGIFEMLAVPGLGPKTVQRLYRTRGIDSLNALQRAAESGQLRTVEGIKSKTEQNILRGIELIRAQAQVIPPWTARETAVRAQEYLKCCAGMARVHIAGSLRRRRSTVHDIDLVAAGKDPAQILREWRRAPWIKEVIAEGETKSSVRTTEHIQVEVRAVLPHRYGAALLYFTGSKQFNIRIRQEALRKGMKLNEYGVSALSRSAAAGRMNAAAEREETMFAALNLPWIPPELREDKGEVEAARRGSLPQLVGPEQIRGDFHVHSSYSDGQSTISEIAAAAQETGYKYIGICDHSQGLRVASGLTREQVLKKKKEIASLQSRFHIRILCGTEVDIRADGSLDYPDEVLEEFDLVIAAVHSGFSQSRVQMTRRLVSACRHPKVHILAHPTGKLRGAREECEMDFKEVTAAAARHRVALEINSFPHRLDLDESRARQAGEAGVKLAISSDAHRHADLNVLSYGIDIARRGWLEANQVLNCMSWAEVQQWKRG